MLFQFILCCFTIILGESWYFMKHLQCYWGLNHGLENVNHPLCYGGYNPVLSTSETTESYFAQVVEAQDHGIIRICLSLVAAAWQMVSQCHEHVQRRKPGERGSQRDGGDTLETSLERKILTSL